MPTTVKTNQQSATAGRILGRASKSFGRVLDRVSSGMRIVRAADDAASLGVSTNLTSRARSNRVAIRNTNDGISMVQASEVALETTTNIQQRLRELAVQSASETLQSQERAYVQDEYAALTEEIGRIASSVEFNGFHLMDGSTTVLEVQVGVNDAADSLVNIRMANLSTVHAGLSTTSVATSVQAQLALNALDVSLDTVNTMRSRLGAVQNRLESVLQNTAVYAENLQSASSQIADAEMAYETAMMTKEQIIHQAASASLSQAKNIPASLVGLLE